jgi:hypothetical protein
MKSSYKFCAVNLSGFTRNAAFFVAHGTNPLRWGLKKTIELVQFPDNDMKWKYVKVNP